VLKRPRFTPLNIPEQRSPKNFSIHLYLTPVTRRGFTRVIQQREALQDNSLQRLLAGVRDLSKILKGLRKLTNLPEDNIWYSDKIITSSVTLLRSYIARTLPGLWIVYVQWLHSCTAGIVSATCHLLSRSFPGQSLD